MIINQFGEDQVFKKKLIKILLLLFIIINTYFLSACSFNNKTFERKSVNETTQLSHEKEVEIINSLLVENVVDSIDNNMDNESFKCIYKITNNSDYYLNGVPITINKSHYSLFLAPGDYGYYSAWYSKDSNSSNYDFGYNNDNKSSDLFGITTEPIKEIIYSSDLTTEILPPKTVDDSIKYDFLVTNNTDLDFELSRNDYCLSYYSYDYMTNTYEIIGSPLYIDLPINSKTSVQTTIFEFNSSIDPTIQDFQLHLAHFNGGYNKKFTNM